jgi:hypothetical protein
MTGPLLEPGINYTKLPPTTRFATLEAGDRVIYNGRTFEVTEKPRPSPSGKKYHMKWRLVDFQYKSSTYGNRTWTNSYLKEYINKETPMSGLTKTTTGRVVYRPNTGYIPHYIEEDVA